MKSRVLRYIGLAAAALLAAACTENRRIDRYIEMQPPIFPDYADVTLPPNLAPPCFALADSLAATHVCAWFKAGGDSVLVKADKGQIAISPSKWKRLVRASADISVRMQAEIDGERVAYAPFHLYIAPDSIDPYLAYRLIEPGYEMWNEMGIYQRCLESYEETPILTNRMTDFGCMNCHSFCNRQPDRMLFHLRAKYAGTYVLEEGNVKKLDTKTPQTMSALVYPSWHPSGDYVAFTVNNTKQAFHTTDPNRVEVFDYASDVVVYDVRRDELVTSPLLSSAAAFETFPTFSPDGRTLYFCSADSLPMPGSYNRVRYSLCAIGFDAATRTFGNRVDTLYNARNMGKSVSFPRVSPDGRFLLFTLAAYGNFSIWHKDADLYLIDLRTDSIRPMTLLNSDDVESYHSWSGNSRWVVFSSRRIDGLYTRLFMAYMDADGNPHKPFLLPQKGKDYYTFLMKSYNIPEFIEGKVKADAYSVSRTAREEPGKQLGYSMQQE